MNESRHISGHNAIKKIRQWRGLTQEDVARRMNITLGSYGHYERGSKSLDNHQLLHLLAILNFPHYIFCTYDSKVILDYLTIQNVR